MGKERESRSPVQGRIRGCFPISWAEKVWVEGQAVEARLAGGRGGRGTTGLAGLWVG